MSDYNYEDYIPDPYRSPAPDQKNKERKPWLDTLGDVLDTIGKGIDAYIKIKDPRDQPQGDPGGRPIFEDDNKNNNKPQKSNTGIIVISVVGVAALAGLIYFIKIKNKNKV